MRKSSLCIIVPAYNEAPVIESSLKALRQVINKKHIYVVSDGSTDKTAVLAKKHVPNVLNLRKNVGKAKALKRLIEKYQLTKRYKYIFFSDADSRISPNFMDEINKYADKNYACIVGTVLSDRKGFISAFRTYEYFLSQSVYKNAQNIMHVIAVAPGCASLYRSDILDQLDFSRHTLTEDFDLTIQIHRKKLGEIFYAMDALVITQDPPTYKDYWKQIMRWYTGTWQNIFLHKLYIPNSKISLELYMILLDSVMATTVLLLSVLHPLLFIRALGYLYLFVVVLAIFVVGWQRKWWAAKYAPLFPVMYFTNLTAYPVAFLRALIGKNKVLSWQKVNRYAA